MKTRVAFLVVLAMVVLCFCSCADNRENTAAGSTSTSLVQLTAEQRELLAGEATPAGAAESVALSHEMALRVYEAMELSRFQLIQPEDNADNEMSWDSGIHLWLYTDKDEPMVGSCGNFFICENDMVCYNRSPVLSVCAYYKAPAGTYEKIGKLLAAVLG